MRFWKWVFAGLVCAALVVEIGNGEQARTERISGSAGDVLDGDPVGRLKVFVYELPSKYYMKILQKDPRCLNHMFAAEIYMHRFLLSTPVYTTCDLTPNGLPLLFKSPRMMRSAIQLISSNGPYWNRTEGADHFLVVLMTLQHAFIIRKRRQLKEEFFPCSNVQPWFRLLGNGIMFA